MSGAQADEEVRGYIDAIPAGHRPLFDRLHRLIVSARPDVTVTISYKMPTYRAGDRRVYLAAWKHGISVYGWRKDDDGGFVDRHPGLKTSTGTIRLRPEDAAITDEEFLGLFRGALGGLDRGRMEHPDTPDGRRAPCGDLALPGHSRPLQLVVLPGRGPL